MVAVLGFVAVVAVACGPSPQSAPAPGVAPADLLLDPSVLPIGFSTSELSVRDLVEANASQLTTSESTVVTPERCRPTADATLNPTLTEANSAVLAAQSSSGGLVELVTTVQRDIGADVVALTGVCARTETTIRDGNLAGARIVTVHTPMPAPDIGRNADKVEQMLLIASATTTTLADQSVRSRIDYVGYALVAHRSGGAPVTLALTVSGDPTAAVAPPAPAPPAQPPISDQEFVTLFGSALTTAVQGRSS